MKHSPLVSILTRVMMRFLLPLLLIALSVPAFAAPAAKPPPGGFVYVVTNDGLAYGYRVLPNGALAPLETLPTQIKPFIRTPEPDYPEQPPDTFNQQGWSASADPLHALLYVTGYHASLNAYPMTDSQSGQAWGALQVYRVSFDGHLTAVYKKPWSFGEALGPITVDPLGRFVWIDREGNSNDQNPMFIPGQGDSVFVFKHGQEGMLRKVDKTTVIGTFSSILRSGSTDDSGMVVAQDGRSAYSYNNTGFVDHHEYAVAAYRVLANGRLRFLEQDTSHREASSLMSFALDPTGRLLYIVSNNVSSDDKQENFGVFVYPLSRDRLKTSRLIVPYPKGDAGGYPQAVLADPKGRFLYVSTTENAHYNYLSPVKETRVYRIGRDGTLTLASRTPGLEVKAVSQDGNHVYALTTTGVDVVVQSELVPLRVGADGRLMALMPVLLPKGTIRQVLAL